MNFSMDWNYWATKAFALGQTILVALAFWIIGGWLIRLAVKLTQRAMATQKIDRTIIGWMGSTMAITLKILLVVAILGYVGFEVTSFAALLAAIGLAIGAAWSGLLAHMAAGVFLIILRPFVAGDIINAGGVTGKVEEVGIFMTTINSGDGIRTYVGNSKIFSDNIQNLSTAAYRRVECTAQLDHTTDHNYAIQLLKERISEIPNVLAQPEPEIGIEKFTPMGPVLAVKPCCHPSHFGQVQFDTNRMIREAFGDAGFQVPKQHFVVQNSR